MKLHITDSATSATLSLPNFSKVSQIDLLQQIERNGVFLRISYILLHITNWPSASADLRRDASLESVVVVGTCIALYVLWILVHCTGITYTLLCILHALHIRFHITYCMHITYCRFISTLVPLRTCGAMLHA